MKRSVSSSPEEGGCPPLQKKKKKKKKSVEQIKAKILEDVKILLLQLGTFCKG